MRGDFDEDEIDDDNDFDLDAEEDDEDLDLEDGEEADHDDDDLLEADRRRTHSGQLRRDGVGARRLDGAPTAPGTVQSPLDSGDPELNPMS